MRRRGFRVSLGLLGAAATLAAGCGVAGFTTLSGRRGPVFAAASSPGRVGNGVAPTVRYVEPAPEPGRELYGDLGTPVADLSSGGLDLPRFFVGFGYALVYPVDRTLSTGSVYDFNVAYDLSSILTLELALGLWDIGDRVKGVPRVDSVFEMRPALLMLQFSGELPRAKSRIYVGVGGGYSLNSYRLGSKHRQYVENEDKIVNYDISVDDNGFSQYAVGWEAYSTADAALNLAIELRYLKGSLEKMELSGGTPLRAKEIVELELYLLRFNVTWHF